MVNQLLDLARPAGDDVLVVVEIGCDEVALAVEVERGRDLLRGVDAEDEPVDCQDGRDGEPRQLRHAVAVQIRFAEHDAGEGACPAAHRPADDADGDCDKGVYRCREGVPDEHDDEHAGREEGGGDDERVEARKGCAALP